MKKILQLAGAIVFVVGCSAGSSEEPVADDPVAQPGAPLPGAPLPGGPASPGAPTSAPPAGTAPAKPPSGTPVPAPAAGAFVGAPQYVATLGPSTIDKSGKGNGHLSFNAMGNPAGHACLDCHDGSGKGGAPAFLFAGTLYADAAGTKPAASAEVRMLGADGKGLSTYTDTNGNFFFRAGNGTIAAPAIAGARTATLARSMTNKINDANCNQCHGTTSRIAL